MLIIQIFVYFFRWTLQASLILMASLRQTFSKVPFLYRCIKQTKNYFFLCYYRIYNKISEFHKNSFFIFMYFDNIRVYRNYLVNNR
jgi:hypothetical protein